MFRIIARNKLASECAVADMVATITLLLGAAYLGGIDFGFLFSENMGLVIFALFVPGLLAAYYGYKHSLELITGQSGWVKPIATGFKFGILYAVFLESVGFVTDTVAAGSSRPSFDYSSAGDWIAYIGILILYAAISGIIGCLLAAILSGLNRTIIGSHAN